MLLKLKEVCIASSELTSSINLYRRYLYLPQHTFSGFVATAVWSNSENFASSKFFYALSAMVLDFLLDIVYLKISLKIPSGSKY